jgi:hypothetical protein
LRIPTFIKFAARSAGNVHRQGPLPDIFLFATPRGGSTWLMEILASQPGVKYFDEPLSPRRDYAGKVGITGWEQLMPDTGDPERVVSFLKALQRGEFGLLNPTPFKRNHRFFTNRNVFKLHEIKHLMDTVAERCNGILLFLLRHPIATSISRNAVPRLPLFLSSKYYGDKVGDPARLREIRAIGNDGSYFEKAIVSWCFENLDVLQLDSFSGLLMTYEELVLNPERACDRLLEYCSFKDKAAMWNTFERPAENIGMSRQQTLEVMQRQDARARRWGLVTKWRKQVTAQQMDQAAAILRLFEIDAYDPREDLAHPRYLLFADTRDLFAQGRTAA